MFNSKDAVIAKLSPRNKQLLELLKTYPELVSKEEKSQRIVDLLAQDKSQTILKFLAREAASQTAFSYTLWLINADLVNLDWIYDMVYTISTNPTRHDCDFKSIYESSKKLDFIDLSMIVTETEKYLNLIKLDDLDIHTLVLNLDQEMAISLLTWFLIFNKVANVDLNYISEISKNLNQTQAKASDAEALSDLQMPPSFVALDTDLEPAQAFSDYDLEDRLIALNLRLGGIEEEVLTRTLDNFIFTKNIDPVSGVERVVFRPRIKVMQYLYDGKERQAVAMKVSSSKTWVPGVYFIQQGEDELFVMRLPGNDYYEVLSEGPDPYLRALTISSMQIPGK